MGDIWIVEKVPFRMFIFGQAYEQHNNWVVPLSFVNRGPKAWFSGEYANHADVSFDWLPYQQLLHAQGAPLLLINAYPAHTDSTNMQENIILVLFRISHTWCNFTFSGKMVQNLVTVSERWRWKGYFSFSCNNWCFFIMWCSSLKGPTLQQRFFKK